MSTANMSLLDFIGHLTAASRGMDHFSQSALEKAAVIVETEAKAELGAYQQAAGPFPAWANLAPDTQKERVQQGFPADEPLLRDATLHDHITHAVGAGEAAVGVPNAMVQHSYQTKPVNIGEVAEDLELGTARMAPRSFLGGAAVRKAPEVAQVLGQAAVMHLTGESILPYRLP